MKMDDFVKLIGGRYATVMVCQEPSVHMGEQYKVGDMLNVNRAAAFALYKQMYNLPGGGEAHRWIPKDANITDHEAVLLNQHFDKEHKKDLGEKPVKVSKSK